MKNWLQLKKNIINLRINVVVRIERTEDSRFLFEDADFSFETIKKLIAQGYNDVERALAKDS
ncbi:MAG: DUF3734 domain-containing protein [Candidatus Nitrosopolaris sp.]|jgi:hypothetical protein